MAECMLESNQHDRKRVKLKLEPDFTPEHVCRLLQDGYAQFYHPYRHGEFIDRCTEESHEEWLVLKDKTGHPDPTQKLATVTGWAGLNSGQQWKVSPVVDLLELLSG